MAGFSDASPSKFAMRDDFADWLRDISTSMPPFSPSQDPVFHLVPNELQTEYNKHVPSESLPLGLRTWAQAQSPGNDADDPFFRFKSAILELPFDSFNDDANGDPAGMVENVRELARAFDQQIRLADTKVEAEVRRPLDNVLELCCITPHDVTRPRTRLGCENSVRLCKIRSQSSKWNGSTAPIDPTATIVRRLPAARFDTGVVYHPSRNWQTTVSQAIVNLSVGDRAQYHYSDSPSDEITLLLFSAEHKLKDLKSNVHQLTLPMSASQRQRKALQLPQRVQFSLACGGVKDACLLGSFFSSADTIDIHPIKHWKLDDVWDFLNCFAVMRSYCRMAFEECTQHLTALEKPLNKNKNKKLTMSPARRWRAPDPPPKPRPRRIFPEPMPSTSQLPRDDGDDSDGDGDEPPRKRAKGPETKKKGSGAKGGGGGATAGRTGGRNAPAVQPRGRAGKTKSGKRHVCEQSRHMVKYIDVAKFIASLAIDIEETDEYKAMKSSWDAQQSEYGSYDPLTLKALANYVPPS